MPKNIILYIATSLDGFIARKDGAVDWLSPYEKGQEDYGYNEFYKKIGTINLRDNKNIWLVGGASIVDEFLRSDLIDEFIITIIPRKK